MTHKLVPDEPTEEIKDAMFECLSRNHYKNIEYWIPELYAEILAAAPTVQADRPDAAAEITKLTKERNGWRDYAKNTSLMISTIAQQAERIATTNALVEQAREALERLLLKHRDNTLFDNAGQWPQAREALAAIERHQGGKS